MNKNRVMIAGIIAIITSAALLFSNHQPATSNSNKSTKINQMTFKKDDWKLKLVNKEFPLSDKYSFNQAEVDSYVFDARIVDSINQFRSAANAAGYPTTVISGYRSLADQTSVYNNSVDSYINQGMTEAEAITETQKTIQTPGSSEHATGLAIDLADNQALASHPELSASMENYKGQQWLINHATDYGFILRYPSDAEAKKTTGIDYEPWHFRYVGKDAAKYMAENDLTLEELQKEIK